MEEIAYTRIIAVTKHYFILEKLLVMPKFFFYIGKNCVEVIGLVALCFV